MELKDFIKETLVEIALGVKEANQDIHENHGGEYTNSPFRIHRNIGDSRNLPGVSFDVAVTAGSGSTDSANAGIKIAQVFGIGGSVESSETDSQTHRIKFSVGLSENWD